MWHKHMHPWNESCDFCSWTTDHVTLAVCPCPKNLHHQPLHSISSHQCPVEILVSNCRMQRLKVKREIGRSVANREVHQIFKVFYASAALWMMRWAYWHLLNIVRYFWQCLYFGQVVRWWKDHVCTHIDGGGQLGMKEGQSYDALHLVHCRHDQYNGWKWMDSPIQNKSAWQSM